VSQLFQCAANRQVDILCIGNPNIDLVFAVGEVPLADQKCLGRRLGTFAGGTTANVACAASRLGSRTAVLGHIGDDPEGQFLKAEFERFNVSTEHLRVAHGTESATAIVMVNEHGERALIYIPMSGEHWGEFLEVELLARSRVIYAMPYKMAPFSKTAQLAREQGASVVIDIEPAMVPDFSRLDELLAHSDVVFFSGSSFHEIFDSAPTSGAIRQLLQKGPRAVIVTLGAQGALAVTADDVVRQPGFAAKVVDSTGAGDCFNGALLAAALEGQSLQHAMRFACAAASISLTDVGARTMLPDREAIASLLRG
jgi:sugar/nucleoside kinase (ribokinase family)